MNKYELKEKIAETVIEIKKIKKELRKNHEEIGIGYAAGLMERLDYGLKNEVRAMYLVYGWFRGRTRKQVDSATEIPFIVIHKAKKLLNEDASPLFLKWLNE